MLHLDRDCLARFSEEHEFSLVVLFGSQAKNRARSGSDTDLAVMHKGTGRDRLELLRLEGELAGALQRNDLDVVWLADASWLLTWEVAQGQVLYEARAGLFREFQVTAWLRRADSRVWIERDRAYLERSLEGKLVLQQELVRRKLNGIHRYLQDLEPLLAPPGEEFANTPHLHYSAERLTQLMVDGAAAINTEVAQTIAGIPPSDYYSSFFSIARTGWIDSKIAMALAPLARLRNRLVHEYEEVQISDIYALLKDSLPHWRSYLESIHQKLKELESAAS